MGSGVYRLKLTYLTERKKKAYNEAMRKRNKVNCNPGKHKEHKKESQKRFAKVRTKESVQIVLKPWKNWTNKIPEQLVLAVPEGYISTKQGIVSLHPKVHMTKKERRRSRKNGKRGL